MSTTTPPPAPKKRPVFLEPSPPKNTKSAEEIWDERMNKVFPPGEFVPLTIAPSEHESMIDMVYKSLPKEFQSPNHTLAQKEEIVSLLAKVWNL
jgi:hypothetical protein